MSGQIGDVENIPFLEAKTKEIEADPVMHEF